MFLQIITNYYDFIQILANVLYFPKYIRYFYIFVLFFGNQRLSAAVFQL